jgi:peptidoglycan/LPS O-acetylase OafA/YrhL
MKRLFELDAIRVIALFLLVIFHSGITSLYPGPMTLVQDYLLGAFFLVSGLLFTKSARKPVPVFVKDKFFRIYVPLLIGLVLVCVTGLMPGTVPLGYCYHATLLSVFGILQLNSLNLYHLWFLVHLLVYMLLFLLLLRFVRSEKVRTSITAVLLALLVFLWAFNSPYSLEWKFQLFLLVFYAGMLLGEGGRLQKIYGMLDRKWAAFLLLFVAVIGMLDIPSIPISNSVGLGLNTLLFIIARNAFILSACLLTLWIARKLPVNKIEKPVAFAVYGLLFAYIIQPMVSNFISCFLSGGICSVGALSASRDLFMIPASFLLTVVAAFFIQKYYDKLTAILRQNFHKNISTWKHRSSTEAHRKK